MDILDFDEDSLKRIFSKKIFKVTGKGIDKKTSSDFQKNLDNEIGILSKKLHNRTFHFSPYVEKLKIKHRDRFPRLISIPTIRDRLVLEVIKQYLQTFFAKENNKKQPNHFIKEVQVFLKDNPEKELYYLRTDIRDFYPSVNHQTLLQMLSEKKIDGYIFYLVQMAIKNPTVPINYSKDSVEKYQNSIGIPQGLSISNILAQIYLADFDKNMMMDIDALYLRYVDDFLIIGSKEQIANLKDKLKSNLLKLKLDPNQEKTIEGPLADYVSYLGYKLNSDLITASDNSFQNYIKGITGIFTWLKKCVDDKKYRPTFLSDDKRLKSVFISRLNEKITGAKSEEKKYGWLHYYVQINDVKLLYRIDRIIDKQFSALQFFDNQKPLEIKRVVRAYYEIKYNNGGSYVLDYNLYDSEDKQRQFLVESGFISPEDDKSAKDISRLYNKIINTTIKNVDTQRGSDFS